MSGTLLAKLTAFEGQPTAVEGHGRDPVNEPMIRHWCEAMGDTNPVYTDREAAAASRFGGIVAPPAMLQAWTMAGLSGVSGNARRSGPYDELLSLLDAEGFTSVVATDCEQEYVRPLRPGDEVTHSAVIESVSAEKRTALGTGHFVTTRMDIRVGGDRVGTHRFRILKYRPRAQAGKQAPPARRPRPVVNRDNEGFWAGVAEHRLLIQRCTGPRPGPGSECGILRFPWLPGCNECGSPDWEPVEACGRGIVFSYVVMHHPPFPAFDPPYAVALVELEEGVRMVGNVAGVPYDEVRIGMAVEVEFRVYDDELTLPVFHVKHPEHVKGD